MLLCAVCQGLIGASLECSGPCVHTRAVGWRIVRRVRLNERGLIE